MLVSEIMRKGVISAHINDSVKKVAELMRKEDVGAVPILEEGKAVGFVTDRDIVISCVADGYSADEPISQVMNEEVISIKSDRDVDDLSRIMEENQISRLLVVDDNERPVGMVSLQDLSQNLTDELNAEILTKIKQ